MLVDSITVGFSPILYCYLIMPSRASKLLSLQPMFPVGLNIQICEHNISIILVCACVHRDWCFKALVDVKIPGAGDDLLSSAAGKPQYVQLERLR